MFANLSSILKQNTAKAKPSRPDVYESDNSEEDFDIRLNDVEPPGRLTAKEAYVDYCLHQSPPLVPSSHFLAMIHRKDVSLRHHSMSAREAAAIAACLEVRSCIAAFPLHLPSSFTSP